MKATSDLWDSPNTDATNVSSFSGLPGGYRKSSDGTFSNVGTEGNWWSSTETFLFGDAMGIGLNHDNGSVTNLNYYARSGFSIRCIKD